jgi:hypothetical protein
MQRSCNPPWNSGFAMISAAQARKASYSPHPSKDPHFSYTATHAHFPETSVTPEITSSSVFTQYLKGRFCAFFSYRAIRNHSATPHE